MSDIADCELRIADFQSDTPQSEIRNPKSVAGLAIFFVLLALVVMLCVPATGMACPLCKESLFDPSQLPQKLATARGYALSIGLMLAMPFGLVAALTTAIVRAQRRRARSIDTRRLSR